jgi:hypothetical protein
MNFDVEANVVVGGIPCQISGTFFIDSNISTETCKQPPFVCDESSTRMGLQCKDVEFSSDCPEGYCVVCLKEGFRSCLNIVSD